MVRLAWMLCGKKNSQRKLAWDQNGIAAFESLKEALTTSFPARNATTFLVCDASAVAVGASLFQVINGEPCSLGFVSKALKKPSKTTLLLTENYWQYTLRSNILLIFCQTFKF